MATIENPAYAAVLAGKAVSVWLAYEDGEVTTELKLGFKTEPRDWLVRQGMDVLMVRPLPVPSHPERRQFNTWIVRVANREVARVKAPLQVLEPNWAYTLSRALCIPERLPAPE